MWRREALQNMPLDRIRSSGYIFLVEMAYVAYLMGYKITETPIYFADRRWGKSKMSLKIQLEAAMRTIADDGAGVVRLALDAPPHRDAALADSLLDAAGWRRGAGTCNGSSRASVV